MRTSEFKIYRIWLITLISKFKNDLAPLKWLYFNNVNIDAAYN